LWCIDSINDKSLYYYINFAKSGLIIKILLFVP
jgi:hypothetical protein